MKDKRVYPAAYLAAVLLLCGCNGGGDISGISATEENVYAETEISAVSVTPVIPETPAEQKNVPENISGEQSVLERLIADTAGNIKGYAVQTPLFGDLDGDGANELIAVYGNKDYAVSEEFFSGSVWFAADGRAEKIFDSDWDWLAPQIVTSCGDTFVKFERHYVTGLVSEYFLIKDSTAQIIAVPPFAMDLRPDSEYGDFIANYDADGMNSETEVVFEPYWFYYLNGRFGEYAGREITEKEFFEYDGAQSVFDEVSADGFNVKNIFKRGNGIITVNCAAEDGRYCYMVLLYRNGKVIYSHDGDGFYAGVLFEDSYRETGFERFCEMIYDTAEGDGSSAVLERYFGDFDGDGKNELYARYGTDGDNSPWLADESGARRIASEEFEKAAGTNRQNNKNNG